MGGGGRGGEDGGGGGRGGAYNATIGAAIRNNEVAWAPEAGARRRKSIGLKCLHAVPRWTRLAAITHPRILDKHASTGAAGALTLALFPPQKCVCGAPLDLARRDNASAYPRQARIQRGSVPARPSTPRSFPSRRSWGSGRTSSS